MKIFRPFIIIALLFLLISSAAWAETRYVSDYLIVTVRSGKGNEFKILETVPTGTPITILEDGKNYAKVRTPKGTEGYISRHYLSKSLPKSLQIEKLNKEIAALQKKLAAHQENLQGSQSEISTYKNQVAELTSQLAVSQQKLKDTAAKYNDLLQKSENILNLTRENEQFAEKNTLLNSELVVLREENQNFHRSNMIQWFLAGGGVFLGGWIIGKISRKKKRRY